MDEKTALMESAPSTAAAPAASDEKRPLLFLHAISRRFRQGDNTLDILKSAKLAVWPGQSVALIAPSGAGKSTLLHIAGLLEQPDAGEVYIDSVATSNLTDLERTRIRRSDIGFVYQFHHLLPEFSAVENVMLPQMIRGLKKSEARTRASELLSYLGLKDRLEHRPAELSGGEQQRVAIATAGDDAPRILLADEPTGNLDQRTSQRVFAAMSQLVRASGLAAIIATHNLDIAAPMDRRVTIREGGVVELEYALGSSLPGSRAELDCFAEFTIGPATSGPTRWLAARKRPRRQIRRSALCLPAGSAPAAIRAADPMTARRAPAAPHAAARCLVDDGRILRLRIEA